ncbi:hypothetical protein [Nitrosomonas sp. Nm33]|uniref:hypothetical protein n=1 Tax=Nitrosomonas sp. Nm33 TaxID=133724 RepID=UPI0008989E34|nr:hypothetical protein [Nitrosomonas sp. Nm33]SDY72303.1 hypothetical protein SAMN05421755_104228 [Nitrosomonas sp. Nm33]
MRNFTRAAAMTLLVSSLLTACALPVENLWPPPPDSAARTIYVSLDTWHAMIAFPQSEEMAVNLDSSVEQDGVCDFASAGQGATMRNGRSIPKSCNAAMRLQNCAIRSAAETPRG